MDKPVETFEMNGKKVEIWPDTDPQNPRIDFDHEDLMICFHSRYTLGDKHDYLSKNYSGWDEMEAQIIKDHDPVVIKRLYMYDHSGLTIATHPFSCPWDSGQIGFILMPKKGAYAAYMTKRITKAIKEKCEKYIDASVTEYDQYLCGDIYGYTITEANGDQGDSCWGFYGLQNCIDEAKGVVSVKSEVTKKQVAELLG